MRNKLRVIVVLFMLILQHELGDTEKPDEIFDIIEHFCLGRRRLHLFGTDVTIRPGMCTSHILNQRNIIISKATPILFLFLILDFSKDHTGRTLTRSIHGAK